MRLGGSSNWLVSGRLRTSVRMTSGGKLFSELDCVGRSGTCGSTAAWAVSAG